MDQISFTDAEFAAKKRKTRREKFLEEMARRCRGKSWKR